VGSIWKFGLGLGGQVVEMPVGAKILHVGEQRGRPTMWAACDPGKNGLADRVKRRVHVVMTGEEEPLGAKYVGTVILAGGDFVVHVYDGGESDLPA